MGIILCELSVVPPVNLKPRHPEYVLAPECDSGDMYLMPEFFIRNPAHNASLLHCMLFMHFDDWVFVRSGH